MRNMTACLALCLLCTMHSGVARDDAYGSVQASRDGTGKTYMGREIAQVMGYGGADWLSRASRAREEKPELLLAALGLAPGMAVADIGAGTGYYSGQIAERIGEGGRVYAVDVQQRMLALLTERMNRSGMRNVRPVLASDTDTGLPPGAIDLALMVDVYHELSHPREVLASVMRALKPGGRLVVVEYRAEDDAVPIKPLHKMSEPAIRREIEASGLVWQQTVHALPWQHVVIFRKP